MSSKNSRLKKPIWGKTDLAADTYEDQQDRRHMLRYNTDRLLDAMKEKNLPVGIMFDGTGRFERSFWEKAHGIRPDQADEITARMKARREVPTACIAVGWKEAEELLSATSPTALQSLANAKAQGVGRVLVCVGKTGNTYAGVRGGD